MCLPVTGGSLVFPTLFVLENFYEFFASVCLTLIDVSLRCCFPKLIFKGVYFFRIIFSWVCKSFFCALRNFSSLLNVPSLWVSASIPPNRVYSNINSKSRPALIARLMCGLFRRFSFFLFYFSDVAVRRKGEK